jgi:amidase
MTRSSSDSRTGWRSPRYRDATGDPAISLPLVNPPPGVPIGMMFSAAPGREARLLELAFELGSRPAVRRIRAE